MKEYQGAGGVWRELKTFREIRLKMGKEEQEEVSDNTSR